MISKCKSLDIVIITLLSVCPLIIPIILYIIPIILFEQKYKHSNVCMNMTWERNTKCDVSSLFLRMMRSIVDLETSRFGILMLVTVVGLISHSTE